jgi:transposase
LLASNLPEAQWNPSKIVAIYKQRMQIEEGFRDVKSEHFGVGVTRHRSHCPRRIEVLLLISALANYIICLTGLQAREAGHEHRFQSNSLKHRRVLSLWRLGLEYWRCGRGSNSRETLERLERTLRDEVHQQAQVLG